MVPCRLHCKALRVSSSSSVASQTGGPLRLALSAADVMVEYSEVWKQAVK